jgi:hypothetical protein
MNLKDDMLFIGEGGFGSKIVKKLIEINTEIDSAIILASDTERDHIRQIENELVDFIQLDCDGTGKKPKIGYKYAQEKEKQIKKLLEDYTFIIHLCGFGGGTGVGTAFYISENNQDRLHIFGGPMPSFNEGQDIIENSIENIELLSEFGRVWPFDNRKMEDVIFYEDINKKITDEINFITSLTDKNWVSRDMDTGNVIDLLFPKDYRKSGILSFKRYEIEDMRKNISFKNLEEHNKSASYDFKLRNFGMIGSIIKLANKEKSNSAKTYIKKFNKWILEQVPGGSVHPGIYNCNDKTSEIILILSGPLFNQKFIEDYVEENDKLIEMFNSNFDEVEKESKLNKSSTKKKKSFNNKSKAKKTFGNAKKKNPFGDDDEDDLLDLLG